MRISARCGTSGQLGFVVLWWILAGGAGYAQNSEGHTHFEVASLRPAKPNAPFTYIGPKKDFGRLSWSRISLRELIENAYKEYSGRIRGPAQIDNEYSLAATIPPGSTMDDVVKMLQNLLAERFALKFHDESKKIDGFDLVIGEGGFKLTASNEDAASTLSPDPEAVLTNKKLDQQGFPVVGPQRGWRSSFDRESGVERASFRLSTIEELAAMLALRYSQKTIPVIDKTEIKGLFDFRLVLPVPSFPGPQRFGVAAHASAPTNDPGVGLAGISGTLEKQIGLRLKAVKVTVRTMVIDNAARVPSEN